MIQIKYIMPKNVKDEGKTELYPGIGFLELVCIGLSLGLSYLISTTIPDITTKLVVGGIITFTTAFLVYGTTRKKSVLMLLIKILKYYSTQQRYFYNLK